MKSKKFFTMILFILILGAAFFVRVYKLGQIPAGVYTDEASLGYNAYSLLLTGKDEFGKSWPVYFRAFSTFQDSLYGYFSVIPVYFLGLSIFSTRLVSVISGLTVVLVSFLIVYWSDLKKKSNLALLAAFTVAFSPWAIYQSRVAVGSNLGLGLTAVGILFLFLSLNKRWFFVLACSILGLASYAYAGQRITSILFPIVFVLINKKFFLKPRKWALVGFALLILIMLPQFKGLSSAGSLVRYQTQGYTQKSTFEKHGGPLIKIPVLGRSIYIARQFTSQYLSVLSPRSLFFEPEPQLVRSIPDLSTFYVWMIIPFFAGLVQVWKKRSHVFIQITFLLLAIGALPEALTGDPFYTLRMLPYLWGITLVIALGIDSLLTKIQNNLVKWTLAAIVVVLTGFNFYTAYFIFLKHERSIWYGYPFQVLAEFTEENSNQKFVLDSEIYDAPYIWMAFYKKLDPKKLQAQAPPGLLEHYYDDLTYYKYKVVGNVEVRKINWGLDPCQDEYIIGDIAAIGDAQAVEHKLSLIREIKDLSNKTILWIFHTNPELKCSQKSESEK